MFVTSVWFLYVCTHIEDKYMLIFLFTCSTQPIGTLLIDCSMGVVALCSYSTIAWVASAHHGQEPDVSYAYKDTTASNTVYGVFNALGDIAFAYAGHNVVLEIQATIPSSPEKPSKIAMWRGVLVAYLIVAICYFPVALVGYWAFGQSVGDNILTTLNKPTWLVAMANLMVVVHVTGSYQVYL